MIYAVVSQNNKVTTIQDMPETFVEIESFDDRVLGTTYDHETGEFIGYRITLSADKTQIVADGEDTATITATVTTWDEQAGTDFEHEVIFEVNGAEIPATVTDGQATFEFASNETGTYTIRTVNDEDVILSNGSIEIEVIDSEE